jgi:hypothetical protein
MYGWTFLLILLIIVTLGGAIAFAILLFVGGTSTIVTDQVFADRIDSDIAFLTEVGLWGIEHLINNFTATILKASPYLFLLVYGTHEAKEHFPFRKFLVRFTYGMYAAVVGIVGVYAIFGEVIEQVGRKIIRASIGNNTAAQESFEGYSSETLDDVILSDLLCQYLFASIEALILLIFVFRGRGPLFFFKRWWIIFLRWLLYLLLPVIGFIGTLRKIFDPPDGYPWPIGFYILACLKICILCILFLEDYIHVTRSRKVREYVRVEDVTEIYVFIIIFVIVQYIASFNLTSWGVVTSHVVTISFILILFFIKLRVHGNLRPYYEKLVI